MNLEYTTDEFGKDLLLQDNGFQVMMEWEKPYMEACIDKLNPFGRVLEIGFGLGYSATHIQTYENVKEHIIIEYSPLVWEKMIPFLQKYPKAKLEKGKWQDVLPRLGNFDCIFFDDAPNVAENLERNQHDFIKEILLDHTNIGARLTCYSSGEKIYIDESKVRLEEEEYKADIPSNCKYVRHGKLHIPLFTKIDDVSKKDLETFFKPLGASHGEETIASLHFSNKELLFNTIQTLRRQGKSSKLNTLCELYLKNNTVDDRQRRLVESLILNP